MGLLQAAKEYEQWRRDNPEEAKLRDERTALFREAMATPVNLADTLSNLQFGQEIQVPIRRKNESKDS